MIRSFNGRLRTLAPMVPLPEISPSSHVSAGRELMNPRSGTGKGFEAAWEDMLSDMVAIKVIAAREQTRCFIIISYVSFFPKSNIDFVCSNTNQHDADRVGDDGY
jgi:hypothetical protein